jgi:ABC-type branched-subunit amino acid transport system ATPase component
MSLLVVKNLTKSFGGVQAVAGISFELAAGELLALIGPNGAGKSTCFNLLNGQLRPDSGNVLLAGRDITGSQPREIRLQTRRNQAPARLSAAARHSGETGTLARSAETPHPSELAASAVRPP